MHTDITAIAVTTDEDGSVNIDVKSTHTSENKLLIVLLEVVEKMTGVSIDKYIDEVDAYRASIKEEVTK